MLFARKTSDEIEVLSSPSRNCSYERRCQPGRTRGSASPTKGALADTPAMHSRSEVGASVPEDRSLPTTRRADVAALLVIMVALALAVGYALAHEGPLGWDEAVYAGHARQLATGLVAPGWQIYRPPGLPVIGTLAAPFGFTDLSLRVLTAALGFGALGIAWLMTRRLWGSSMAAVAVLLAAIGSPIVLVQLSLFHDDLPSVGLLLGLMLVLWVQFEGERGPNRWLLAAAPLAAAAFYVRYGTLVAIGGIGLTSVLLWHRPMRGHPRLLAGTVGLAALLFAPHVIYAISATGSPLGIVRAAVVVADSSGSLTALRHYVAWLGGSIAGRTGSLLIVIGLLWAGTSLARSIWTRTISPPERACLWLGIPAVITVVGLVLVSHAERRYVLFPLFLALIVGGGGVAAGWTRLKSMVEARGRLPIGRVAVGIVFLLVVVGVSLGVIRSVRTGTEQADASAWVAEAGRAIRADSAGPCLVASALTPIMTWYSRCDAVQMGPSRATGLLQKPFAGRIYLVFTAIDQTQVSSSTVASYRALVTGPPTMSFPVGPPARAEVYRLTP